MVFLAAVFATEYTREYCNFHQIPGQIHANTGRVLYKPTCISEAFDRSTMGKAIKHGFWGCFYVNSLPMRERLQGTENNNAQKTLVQMSVALLRELCIIYKAFRVL